jgi:hypothetical protein
MCFWVQTIKGNRKSYEDLALHVEQLLVAISTALQNARPERLGAMTANVERLMKCVLFILFASWTDLSAPKGAERDPGHYP